MNSPHGSAQVRAAIVVAIGLLGLIGCTVSPNDDAGDFESERHTIDITIENGEVLDDAGPVEVSVGDHVELRVSADVSDEVHVHGYDVLQAVGPDDPATLSFVADVPGQFEAELEKHRQTILELRVR